MGGGAGGGSVEVAEAVARRGQPGAGAAVAGLSSASIFAAMLAFYCFSLSYDLPSTDLAIATGEPLPAFTLASHDGTAIDLRAAGQGRLVLVFYRGFW